MDVRYVMCDMDWNFIIIYRRTSNSFFFSVLSSQNIQYKLSDDNIHYNMAYVSCTLGGEGANTIWLGDADGRLGQNICLPCVETVCTISLPSCGKRQLVSYNKCLGLRTYVNN